MPYLGYLLAQALKAGDTIAQAITSASNFVTKVGGSVVDLSPSVEALKSPSDGSAYFNGSSNSITLDDVFSYTKHTIAAWVYVEANADSKYIFCQRDSNDDGFRIMSLSTETIFYSVNSIDLQSSNSYYNRWVYVTGTYDGSTMKLYINGNEDQSVSASQTVSTSGNAVIGRAKYSAAGYYEGNIANVAIWSRALSASEIRSVMNKSYDDLNASETQGLVSWYALDDITGTTVPDSHGNYNGTAY